MSAPELPRIVQAGDPALRAQAARVDEAELGTAAFRELVKTMVAVMRAAPGVGLAAPQIGIGKQVIVVEDPADLQDRVSDEALAERGRVVLPLTVIVNPTLRLVEGARATFMEGCLSLTGFVALVPRAVEVEVTGIDATGPKPEPRVWRLRGWPARILQHEVDHLRGALYVDRMHSRSLCSPEEVKRWVGHTTAEIAAGLGVEI